jgi:hypothetical protein
VLFPPELVPGVGHPLVDKLGNHAMRLPTMRKLESYNDFTEKLEYKAVMAGSIKIAENPQAFGLARISHADRCIGGLILRKSCCDNGLSQDQGISRCRQSVARICSALHASRGAR